MTSFRHVLTLDNAETGVYKAVLLPVWIESRVNLTGYCASSTKPGVIHHQTRCHPSLKRKISDRIHTTPRLT